MSSHTSRILFSLLFLLSLVTLWMVQASRHVLLLDYHNYLNNTGVSTPQPKHAYLAEEYKNRLKLFRSSIKIEEYDLIQLRIIMLLNVSEIDTKTKPKLGRAESLVFSLLSFYRTIKYRKRADRVGHFSGKYIDAAFYYETNRLYSKAIELYNTALQKGEGQFDRDAVMLHLAYCYSLNGNYQKSKEIYLATIRDAKDPHLEKSARQLLKLQLELSQNLYQGQGEKKQAFDSALGLYALMKAEDALKVLSTVDPDSSFDRSRLLYYKAKCYEELGKKARALRYFQQVVEEYPQSEYARYANRNIFRLGISLDNSDEILKLAYSNNVLLADPLVEELQSEQALIYSRKLEKSVARTLLADPIPLDSDMLKAIHAIKQEKQQNKRSAIAPQTLIPGKRYRIVMKGGSSLAGELVELADDYLIFDTIIGNLTIDMSKIDRIVEE